VRKILIFFILILEISLIFADNYDLAYQYYLNGLKYYQNGQYQRAQEDLEKAIQLSPKLEGERPEIKMYLGLSAFQNKDYKTAEIYLNQFKGNPLVDQALEIINFSSTDQQYYGASVKIDEIQSQGENDESDNFNFSVFLLIMLIIFSISMLIIISVIFWMSKHYNQKRDKEKNPTVNIVTESIETLNKESKYKLFDQFENKNIKLIWESSVALKKLIGLKVIEENEKKQSEELSPIPEIEEIEELENKIENEITNELSDLNIEDIEKMLEKLDDEKEEVIFSEIKSEEHKKEYLEMQDILHPDSEMKDKYSTILKKEEKQVSKEDAIDFIDAMNELESKDINQSNLQKFFHKLFHYANQTKPKD
jgi:tetratricopeptide (TPR) repeat protein